MTRDRKKPGWAFWTCTVLLVFVLYVASYGPAVWIAGKTRSIPVCEAIEVIYSPLQLASEKSVRIRSVQNWFIDTFRPIPTEAIP